MRQVVPGIALACAFLLTAPAASSQMLTRVDLDNDSFNFWQPSPRRADREYTQGTRIARLWSTRSSLASRLLGGPQVCTGAAEARDCRMFSVGLAQAIYTPILDPRLRRPEERPFAGWLGVELGVQRDRATSLTAFGLTAGLTGRASLAEPAQKAIHRLLDFRPPVGWENQVPTEVAFAVSYLGARQWLGISSARTGMRVIVAPMWTARLGSLATDASVGLHLTAGLRPPVPWSGAALRTDDRWGLFVRAGATQRAVARNLFLDGSTFGRSASVQKQTIIGEAEFGIGLRAPAGVIEWRVHSRSREYRLQPRPHAYSTFAFSLR